MLSQHVSQALAAMAANGANGGCNLLSGCQQLGQLGGMIWQWIVWSLSCSSLEKTDNEKARENNGTVDLVVVLELLYAYQYRLDRCARF